MKRNPRIIFESRKRLDQQLQVWEEFRHFVYCPPKGWIKAIREALGMSSRQMAENLGKTNSEILSMEQREAEKKITLQTLEKAASALQCKLVYFLVPFAPLERVVEANAYEAAEKIVAATNNSMALEDQKVSDEATKSQIKDLAFEMTRKLDPRIWSKKT